jgi:hypothetical protein
MWHKVESNTTIKIYGNKTNYSSFKPRYRFLYLYVYRNKLHVHVSAYAEAIIRLRV